MGTGVGQFFREESVSDRVQWVILQSLSILLRCR